MDILKVIWEWYDSLTGEEKELYLPIVDILAENDNRRHAWFQIVLGMAGARFLQAAVELRSELCSGG